ncbi:MAG: hypothetical protein HYT93_02520 [Parcubacteria group bacterium]|nr:hypothetical protein [Parcubacteria group bacterium]
MSQEKLKFEQPKKMPPDEGEAINKAWEDVDKGAERESPRAPQVGEQVILKKRSLRAGQNSEVEVGETIDGVLMQEIRIGEPLYFGPMGHTSDVRAMRVEDGKLIVETRTSVYEVMSADKVSKSGGRQKNGGEKLDVNRGNFVEFKKLIDGSTSLKELFNGLRHVEPFQATEGVGIWGSPDYIRGTILDLIKEIESLPDDNYSIPTPRIIHNLLNSLTQTADLRSKVSQLLKLEYPRKNATREI